MTPLIAATASNHHDCASLLAQAAGDFSQALWHRAAAGDAPGIAEALAAAAAGGAAADANWCDPAVGGGATALAAAASRGDAATVAALLAAPGIQVGATDAQVRVPPHPIIRRRRRRRG